MNTSRRSCGGFELPDLQGLPLEIISRHGEKITDGPPTARTAAPASGDGNAPNPVDAAIGRRIQLRRQMLRLGPEGLAYRIGVPLRELQAYEKGTSRVSASRLYSIAEVLGVPVLFLLEDAALAAPPV